jgi:D-alanine-D-alanine ligase-like ATP-grasp enzyme
VPYQLPKELEAKIDVLMQKLQLNTGSLDFMVTEDNQFYFLEVNPVGQFGMVSVPCNYYLEQKIADYLLQ